ncbi:MAG: DNA mismatch repair endonuclease MutL [Ruminococcaceae bacterium]|nr:DNA mismatch repair endonuclease MutL [Oscillospiraceae bacterium]
MQKINLLDTQVANLIAAGEVVERPASAIKELLENSIDAGATQITAEIKNGGVSLMRITDNGCGMSKEDALVCTRRHATSKIKDASDLDGIVTLGFRGEALAAISSVSKMRIMTRTKDSELGVMVTSEGGNIVSCEESGCPYGTTVIVEELFSNVPARRKFLKRDASETAAVSAVMEKLALSRPDIAFKFIVDGNLRFQTAGDNSLVNVIYAVLGRDFAKKTVKVHDMTDGVEVEGVIGTPDNVRGNRGAENFFINGRYIRCGTASAALEHAFSSYIPSDKFPSCVLAITVNPAFVDVNVHPQKLEVKFSNDKPIFNAVYCAVRNTLMNGIDRPTMGQTKLTGDSYKLYRDVLSMKTETEAEAEQIASEKERLNRKYEQITVPVEEKTALPDIEVAVPKPILMPWETEVKKAPMPSAIPAQPPVPNPEPRPTFTERPAIVDPIKAPENEPKVTLNEPKTVQNEPKNVPKEPIPTPFFKIAGVMFNTYVFVELENKMMIIDKHAAHERVLFEKMRANMSSLDPVSQLLLFPVNVQLTPEEMAACDEYRDELIKLGFDFVEGEKGVDLIQYPSGLNDAQAVTMFSELASRLSDGHGDLKIGRDAFYEKALYQASCKAAVKGGREDSPENIRWIAEQVIVNPNIRFCPHGRPVAFEMTKSEFERQFERT